MSLISVETDVSVPTRDGIFLATTVIRPSGKGRRPAILMRTPYDRSTYASESLQVHALSLAERGYGVLLQDVRGRGGSGGYFDPFVNEQADGLDTVDWAADQPWCNGAVGLAGISYNAFAQMALVSTGHEAVKCWVPGLTPCDVRSSWIRRGGLFDMGFHLSWGLRTIASADTRTAHPDALLRAFDDPMSTARRGPHDQPELASTPAGKWYFEWLESEDPFPDDPRVPREGELSTASTPALVVAGWFDVFSSGSLELATTLRAGPAGPSHRLVAGPWDHSGLPLGRSAGARDFGLSAAVDLHHLQLQWFDQHLRGGDEVDSDRVFITGRNTWTTEHTWPPGVDDLTLLLGADRSLGTEGPAGALEVHVDALDPTPVLGGAVFPWEPALLSGSFDQRVRQSRPDVVDFATMPLTAPVLVAGEPQLGVTLMTPDGSVPVHATLVEITSGGQVWNVSDGMARTSPTDGSALVGLGPVAHEFAAGSSVGLDVAFAADVRLAPATPGRRVIDLSEGRAVLTLPVVS